MAWVGEENAFSGPLPGGYFGDIFAFLFHLGQYTKRPAREGGPPFNMKTILAILILAGLVSAQTPPPTLHNVLLTWDHVLCSLTVTTNCSPTINPNTGNPITYTFNMYKAPSVCPAAGTDPKTASPPFSSLATGITVLTYTDVGGISAGQTWCYYVTASSTDPFFITPESGPSNYAPATMLVPPVTQVPPTNTKATVQ